MKITKLRTKVVNLPLDSGSGIGSPSIRTAGCILAFLETDQDLVGEGLVFSLNGNRLKILNDLVLSLEPFVVGLDIAMSGAFAPRAVADMKSIGVAGFPSSAIAAIENALWDLRAKALNVNIAAMLGACRSAIPVYHSGGLWVERSTDALQKAAEQHLRLGFRAMKMRLTGDAKIDIPRVRAVRDVIGDEIGLMADANQKMTVPQAIRLGRILEEFHLIWLEEPVSADNHAGEAQVSAALDTPIASGESAYTSAGIHKMLEHRAADIVMPDLQRMGGPLEFIKAANLAAAYNIPVSSHLFSEMSIGLLAAIPNAIILEFMPWFSAVYNEDIELDEQGHAMIPLERPGWGFSLNMKMVEKYLA
jgi:L-alanine-DL-glutamate epimerase-like enolase superfamily enzyme